MLRIVETKGPLSFSDQEELTLAMMQGVAQEPPTFIALEEPIIPALEEITIPKLSFWRRFINKVKTWPTRLVDYILGRKRT